MKKKLLYVSPFWPIKSGISEYSEMLVDGLKKYFDITLLLDGYSLKNRSLLSDMICDQYNEKKDYSGYDFILYNFGNNPVAHLYMFDMLMKFPGYVILHDFTLFFLSIAYYQKKGILLNKIYKMSGGDGFRQIRYLVKKYKRTDIRSYKELASILPLNLDVINAAKGIFTHSTYTANKIERLNNSVPVHVINHVERKMNNENGLNLLRKRYGIASNSIIVASLGGIGETKQNKLICDIIKKYNSEHEENIYYIMIGEGDYVNNYLGKHIKKTGFVENTDTFTKYIADCNLIFNLRWPYYGETSGTLMQCMGMGKRCIVTDVGSFSELPNDVVIKVQHNIDFADLYNMFVKIIEDREFDGRIAQKYVQEECSVEEVSKNIYTFMMNMEARDIG